MKRFAAVVGIALSLSYVASAAMVSAYDSSSQAGNQSFSGSLGLDFNVNSPITVSALGAFVGSNNSPTGLSTPVTVTIYNRTTGLPVATETVSGTANSTLGGYDLLSLGSPVTLPSGFQGSVVVSGYGASEFNCNTLISGCTASTENSNGGLISFVGSGRFGVAGAFPTTLDTGTSNVYGAGTFSFAAAAVQSGVPEPASMGLLSLGLIGLGAIRLRKRA
jgi:PEP-CTERM motif